MAHHRRTLDALRRRPTQMMKYFHRIVILCGLVTCSAALVLIIRLVRQRATLPPTSSTCKPRVNIAFLKTHKCASTSVQNMLFRFGLRYNLTFMLPASGNYLGRRQPFRASLVRALPWHPLGYNIHAVHNRWSHAELASVMPPDTAFVTMLRDPVAVFVSLYKYAELDRALPLRKFLERQPIPDQRFRDVLGRNQMLWDLGLPTERLTDPAAIGRLIADTERRFHLVMIAERFEESLVLLKHLLCWRTDDLVGLRLNARRPEARLRLPRRARSRLKRWLEGDYSLYSHFYAAFERRVAAFGEQHMRREVAELRAANRRLLETCPMESSERVTVVADFAMFSDRVYGYQPRNRSDFCDNVARPELLFIQMLRARQLSMARQHGLNVTGEPQASVEFGTPE